MFDHMVDLTKPIYTNHAHKKRIRFQIMRLQYKIEELSKCEWIDHGKNLVITYTSTISLGLQLRHTSDQ